MYKFRKGDKVVPHSKSVVGAGFSDLHECYLWSRAREKDQNFLYVIEYDKFGGKTVLVLSDSEYDSYGNYYLESDVIPYLTNLTTETSSEDLEIFNLGQVVDNMKEDELALCVGGNEIGTLLYWDYYKKFECKCLKSFYDDAFVIPKLRESNEDKKQFIIIKKSDFYQKL
jgi:hypothetical protein